MPILRVKNGSQKGLEVELKRDTLVIGRDELPDGGLQILDQGISRRHAEIFRIGEMFFIRDLGSRNGTFVNEERITEELLRVGDEVKIGSTVCMFEDRQARDSQRRVDVPGLDAISATTTIRLDLMDDLIADPVEETQQSRDLQILYKVAKTIAAERDIKGLAKKVVKLGAMAISASQAYMFIKHPDRGELTLAASWEKDGKRSKEPPMVSRAMIKQVLKYNRGILTSDATSDSRFKDRGSVLMKGIRSVICAPLVAMDQICGVLYLTTAKISEAFDTDDLELVTAIGIQAGMAVQGITLSLAQETNYLELVGALVRAIEMRDPISRGHSERVATYCSGIAQALGLSRARNRRVQLAALLHNIGILFVTKEENEQTEGRELDLKRIELACSLLEKIQGMSYVVPAVRHHRERFDGTGYPEGLSADDIPLEARVIAVANEFDLLIERAAEAGEDLSTKDAVSRLTTQAQSAYDPKVLEALMTAHREGWLYKPHERVKVS